MKQHRRNKLSACVGVGLAAALSIPLAHAAPLATSTTTTGCGYTAGENRNTIGPLTAGISDSCDRSGLYTLGAGFAPSTYSGSSAVSTSFGPGMPIVGNVVASAAASAHGSNAGGTAQGTGVSGGASAAGEVTFYFTVEAIRIPPSSFVPKIYFEARADGGASGDDWNGGNSSYYYAYAAFPAAMSTAWSISGSTPSQFVRSQYFDLPANDPLVNPFYKVTIGARCDALAWVDSLSYWGTKTSDAWAECQTAVDPVIRLGQEEFDAVYGADSFPLADYYRLQFSANVGAIPLPPAVWLFGSGLLGLVAVARRKTWRKPAIREVTTGHPM